MKVKVLNSGYLWFSGPFSDLRAGIWPFLARGCSSSEVHLILVQIGRKLVILSGSSTKWPKTRGDKVTPAIVNWGNCKFGLYGAVLRGCSCSALIYGAHLIYGAVVRGPNYLPKWDNQKLLQCRDNVSPIYEGSHKYTSVFYVYIWRKKIYISWIYILVLNVIITTLGG